MTNRHIINLIREAYFILSNDDIGLTEMDLSNRAYAIDEVLEFQRDLIEVGNRVKVVFLDQPTDPSGLASMLNDVNIPLVVIKKSGNSFVPVILSKDKKGKIKALEIGAERSVPLEITVDFEKELLRDASGQMLLMGVFTYKSLVSEDEDGGPAKPISPVKRLLRLLSEEKKDIFYILTYAVFVGLISLTLPLGIQATVELVSGGVFFSSIYILIALVLLGVLASGGLQVMQITLVEYLQRRIFTKAAFEFTYRIPRMKAESLSNLHAPELVNRFFDVLTIQKGLPKIFGDLTAGSVQILFGLILLSFYHPFFVFFGLFLVLVLFGIFRLTGPGGLKSSIKESKYKYKVVYWLEEIARTINSFKIAGNTQLPIKKTEANVSNYLINRRAHFKILMSQYMYIILFKAIVTGGLLIIGTQLVIDRQITLGQFVASEVIIILILGSVEKIITYMDVVYDVLTAVDKISQVTDLPLEKTGGIDLSNRELEKGFRIQIRDLSYKYPGSKDYALKNVSLSIKCGEKICIAGGSDSGKTTLTNTIAGLNHGYEGLLTINDFSMRDLDLTNLRDKMSKNVTEEDLFDGTLLENILLGKAMATPEFALDVVRKVGLSDKINMLPEGLHTHIVSGGKGFSSSFINKLILARCLAKSPQLLILNDYFSSFPFKERQELIDLVTRQEKLCTLIAVSNNPSVMMACDRVLILEKGSVKAEGSFQSLLKAGELNDIIEN
jgi:ABC-type bacteriocin/lantibiotic exporter with double-glycine peptidase domain